MADWNINENPNEETIKCVVVGDNNVGKTRLICSRAYNEDSPNYSCRNNNQTSHVPTVWAIDQYRTNSQVLQNARCEIDGIVTSLRLWDTFGDHHKNRRFAYGKADVVLVCFSVCDKKSLEHVRTFWIPEVRRHCKNIPIVLVACKADLRFNYRNHGGYKGFGSKEITADDLIYPDVSALVAQQINCTYYETSVFLGFGIDTVFTNACRAALICRKNTVFWANSALKKVQRPGLQEPLVPPAPSPPSFNAPMKRTEAYPNLIRLYEEERFTDVAFQCQGGTLINAHKVILASASPVFNKMFQSLYDVITTSADDVTTSCCGGSGCFACSRNQTTVYEVADFDYDVMQIVMSFCYTGLLLLPNMTSSCMTSSNDEIIIGLLTRVIVAAQHYGLKSLVQCAACVINDDDVTMTSQNATETFLREQRQRLKTDFLNNPAYSDVLFLSNDGKVYGHRVLLAGGSDVMNAMFTGRFIESSNKEINFSDTTTSCLLAMFEFIYTSTITSDIDMDAGELISLANRLCLPDLVSLLEFMTVKLFRRMEKECFQDDEDDTCCRNDGGKKVNTVQTCEDVIFTMVLSHVHNAVKLYQWCLHFLCVHYNDVCRSTPKLVKSLPAETQKYLEQQRWPPVWYIKQKDVYDKCIMRKELQSRHNRRAYK